MGVCIIVYLDIITYFFYFFFFSSRRRHTRYWRDWSSDVCSSDLPVGVLPLCLTLLAQTRALMGDTAGAEELLGDWERITHEAVTIFEPLVCLARAWLDAARGATAKAGDEVLEAAALAADQGQLAVEALLLHSGIRFGRAADVAERLRELGRTLDSPLVEDLAAHAEAVLDRERVG